MGRTANVGVSIIIAIGLAVGGIDRAEAAPTESEPEDLGWGEEDEAPPPVQDTPAPETPPPPASTAEPPTPESYVPTPEEVDLRERRKHAERAAIAGYVFTGLGGLTLLFLSLPALGAADVARDRAADDPVLTSETELENRAKRRVRFAKITALIGLGGLVTGGVMIGAGLGTRNKYDRELQRIAAARRQARLSPWVDPSGAGLAISGRF